MCLIFDERDEICTDILNYSKSLLLFLAVDKLTRDHERTILRSVGFCHEFVRWDSYENVRFLGGKK